MFKNLNNIISNILFVLFFSLYFSTQALAATPQIELTDQEREWLADNHTVRARVSYWPPYMFSKPTPSGMSVDYIDAIAKRFGFKVEFIPDTLGWPASMQDVMGERRHYDLLMTMNKTTERAQQFALTDDYISMPWVIYTRKDSLFISGLESLDGKIVAAEKGYVITEKLKTKHPVIRILEVSRPEDALRAVATGQADAYVGNLSNASFLIRKHGFSNLVVAAPTAFGDHKQAMAVRKDWSILTGMINKGLAAMTPEERNAIAQKWGAVKFKPRIDYTLVLQVGALAAFILLGIGYWNRRLQQEIHRREALEIAITETNNALNNNKRQLEIITDNIPAIFFTKDINGQHLMINHRFEIHLGINKEYVIGKTDKELFPPDVAEAIIERDRQIFSNKVPLTLEESVPISDGTMHTFLSTKVPLLDEAGEAYALIGIAIDITEQKNLQKELLKAKESAELANRTKSIFLSNMSHEIRTPMNAIFGFSELLSKTKLDNQQAEHLARSKKAADTLLAVIGDVLELSKIEAGKLSINKISFNAKTILVEVIDMFQFIVMKKGLDLKYQIDDIPQYLLGDPERIKQVMINLIGNAIKFTQNGSIHVSLHVNNKNEDHYSIEFIVSDTGIGIKKENLSNLFERFTQVDNSTICEEGGTGLGLAISKELVEAMGGSIEVESEYGEGTIFSFELALDIAKTEPNSNLHSEYNEVNFIDIKILLVEDNEDNRDAAVELLKHMGAYVDTAVNGKIALEMVKKNHYDLVLMDIQMPVMDGLTATRRIREDGFKELPIIAMSAHTSCEEQQKSINAGMNAHINKPFKPKELKAVMTELFSDKKVQKIKNTDMQDRAWVESLDPIPGIVLSDKMYDYWLNKDMFLSKLEQFLDNIQDEKNQLNRVLDEDNITDAKRLLHSLKGSAKLFNAQRLLKSIENLEDAFNDDIKIDITDLRSEFDGAVMKLSDIA